MLMQMCREDEQGNVLVYEELALVDLASVSAWCDVMNMHVHLQRSTVCLYVFMQTYLYLSRNPLFFLAVNIYARARRT